MDEKEVRADSAFGFDGSWREFAPIAFTNLLLTLVTLGIYRFWAIRRERQYLWSRTRFIDDRLEWTGTGLELLIGSVIVLIGLGVPFLIVNFGVQALALRGYPGVAALVSLAMVVLVFYLVGVARFRMLRYRLGRTYWHGIRGGSDDQGFSYGLLYMAKTALGYLPMGLMVPWAMVSLWNDRWQKLSFGNQRFRCDAEFSPIMWRYVAIYLAPMAILIFLVVVGFTLLASGAIGPDMGQDELAGPGTIFAFMIVAGIYIILPLFWLFYYAAFLRLVIGELQLGGLDFAFDARSKQWFGLIFGDIALVVGTLGIGWIFLSYRHWKFFITHMQAYGEVDLLDLHQSETRRAGHGEGLFEALDVGGL